jgi:hypothetical protein
MKPGKGYNHAPAKHLSAETNTGQVGGRYDPSVFCIFFFSVYGLGD